MKTLRSQEGESAWVVGGLKFIFYHKIIRQSLSAKCQPKHPKHILLYWDLSLVIINLFIHLFIKAFRVICHLKREMIKRFVVQSLQYKPEQAI